MLRNLCITAVAGLYLMACAQQPGPYGYGSGPQVNKETVGGVIGAAGGAVAGAQFGKGSGQVASIAAGTLLGAMIGSSIGQTLDNMDRLYHEQAAQRALETARSGTAVSWNNPDSGHTGSVTPLNVIQRPDGEYCREYSQTISVGGKSEDAYGTACRQPDGSWKIAN